MHSLNLVSLESNTSHPPQLINEPSLVELELRGFQDDQRLMIALGEMLGCPRPVNPKGISRCPELLIVWLDQTEAMVIPHPRFGYDLEGALRAALGEQIEVELIPDASLQLTLNNTEWNSVLGFEHRSITSRFLDNQPSTLCVRPSTACSELRLLLQQQDQELLQRWIQQLCH